MQNSLCFPFASESRNILEIAPIFSTSQSKVFTNQKSMQQ